MIKMPKMEYEKLKLVLAILKAMRDHSMTDEPLSIRRTASVLGYSVEHLNKMKGWMLDMKLMAFAGKKRNNTGMSVNSYRFDRMVVVGMLKNWDETALIFYEIFDNEWLEMNDVTESIKRARLY